MALGYYNDSSPWMIQQAKEELQKLETEHPNRYKLLKQELETFIANESASAAEFHHQNLGPSSTPISTQASTSIRKRKRCPQIQNMDQADDVVQWNTSASGTATSTTTKQNLQKMEHQEKTTGDAAIERAKACLEKLRIVKDSLRA